MLAICIKVVAKVLFEEGQDVFEGTRHRFDCAEVKVEPLGMVLIWNDAE